MFTLKEIPCYIPNFKPAMKSLDCKINKVLFIVLVAFLMIATRVLHLSIVLRESLLKEAEKPKLRTMLLKADRGEIWDRFHIPLAQNRICYNATIYYSQISQVPSRGFSFDESGNKIKTSPRKELIQNISQFLGKELALDPARIEDLIYSKASLFPHVPFLIKSHLTEKQYYKIKMTEKDFPGLYAEIGSERYYPQGKVACHILGTLGQMSQNQYMAISEEINTLQEIINDFENCGSIAYLPLEYNCIDDVYQRLNDLRQKAYCMNDKVGKTGIEGQFEQQLRGLFGTKTVEVDNLGKPIKELSLTNPPTEGNTIVLSISSQLQQFAEELLIQNEKDRQDKLISSDSNGNTKKTFSNPWIKGGSIVALDPKTGEVLALASYPRFDPNDFANTEKNKNTLRWIETEKMIGSLWDGKENLLNEKIQNKKISEELTVVSWDFYLNQILPPNSSVLNFFEKQDQIKHFIQIQEDFSSLQFHAKIQNAQHLMEAVSNKSGPIYESIKSNPEALFLAKKIDSYFCNISHPKDRLFIIDLCRLAVDSTRFSDELIAKLGTMKISTYRALNQAFCRYSSTVKDLQAKIFRNSIFASWRKEHQKVFLTQKRLEEKQNKTYAKPYLDYLDQKEKELFEEFWQENSMVLLLESLKNADKDPDHELLAKSLQTLCDNLAIEMLKTFRSFEDLDTPLLTTYRKLKSQKNLACAFYPEDFLGYSRSNAYQIAGPLGSIFKVLVSYEGLRQGHNPLLIDIAKNSSLAGPGKKQIVAFNTNNTPFYRQYKGGRLPKSKATNIGKIDITGALESSSNPYYAILAKDYLKDPEDLNIAALLFGYGQKTGLDLPGEAKGNIPGDLKTNTTGLYSYAIGQHTLLSTPIQAASMLATVSNGGLVLKPQIVKSILKQSPMENSIFMTPVVKKNIWMSQTIKNLLFEGMDKCVWGSKGGARPTAIRSLLANPVLMHDFLQLQHQMIGKTSTAEVLFNPYKNPSSKASMCQHVGFGAIAFPSDTSNKICYETPELVVVVMLRYADAGKEAAPLAAQMIRKWREIKASHRNDFPD